MAAEKNQNTLYLVTGGAGFLGGTVCRQLVDQGHRVRAFMLPNDPEAFLRHSGRLGRCCSSYRQYRNVHP